MSNVAYLGHIFTGPGMSPGSQKIQAILKQPEPQHASAVRQILGLASYYQRYLSQFSDNAAPLNALAHKGAHFNWTRECTDAFATLKEHLMKAQVLAYPRFDCETSEFFSAN